MNERSSFCVSYFLALFLVALSMLATSSVFAESLVNINTADATALESLNGIGPSKAQAIIEYREGHGPFASIEDIQNVSGIGPATFASIKDHITVAGGVSSVPSQETSSPTSESSQAFTQASGVSPSASEISVDGGSDRVVIVGADVQFIARAYDRTRTSFENASFVWNFGDGSTAHGISVLHRFEYPGRYAVVVTGTKDNLSSSDRFIVTAERAQLSVHVLSDGAVEIKNLGGRDIDLSRWIVQSAGQRFLLPDNSLVLTGEVMHISPNTLHFYASNSTELDYPDGTLAFRAEDLVAETIPAPSSPSVTSVPAAPPFALERTAPENDPPQDSNAFNVPKVDQEKEEVSSERIATSSQTVAVGGAVSGLPVRDTQTGSWKWWLSALGLAGLAGGALVLARRFGKKEWNIIEDSGS